MALRNPPLVEAWIEFRFRGNEAQKTWPHVDDFFDEIAADYPLIQGLVQDRFNVPTREPTGFPKEIEWQTQISGKRAFDATQRKCVQLFPDALFVNSIRNDQDYEGFQSLLDSALMHFDRYIRFFHPTAVISCALHYADIVSIRREAGRPMRLEDYFRVGIKLPNEDEWRLGLFEIRIGLPLDDTLPAHKHLFMTMTRQPPDIERLEERFRFDWHAVFLGFMPLESVVVRSHLSELHDATRVRFRESFTDAQWAAFEEEPA